MLDVRRLRVLKEVGAAGSVTGAAANLGYTHSAVSQQLRALERETATALVERSGRGVRLTYAAHVLVDHATKVLAQLERAEADLVAARAEVGGRVRLASFPTATAALLTTALVTLQARYPELDVQVVDMEPQESLPALRHRRVDLALAYEYDLIAPSEAADLDHQTLFTEPVLLVCTAPIDSAAPLKLADYAESPWIAPRRDSTCGMLVDRACATAGFAPGVIAHVGDFATAAALAAEGLGVTLIPALGYRHDPRLQARPVQAPHLTRRVYVATRSGSDAHPAISAVLATLKTSRPRS